ncbi:MAG: type II toxin-antitoxin system VapC family toxin [Verrucomicrobiota bacterium]
MLGIDTNLLVRLIVADDEEQADRAQRVLESRCSEEEPGFVNAVVLAEFSWVLAKSYGYDRESIAVAIESLLSAKALEVQFPVEAWEAAKACRGSMVGFADFYLAAINRAQGCDTTLTFDRKAAVTEGFEGI